MRRGGRTRPQAPLIQAYARRRGLVGTIQQQRGRTRLLEVAPRVGGVVNITRVTAGSAGVGGGGENIQQTLVIGDDAVGEDLFNLGKLSFVDGGELAIDAGGAITITDSFHTVTTFATGTADDLDTINGGSDEQFLMLRLASGSAPVTVKHGTGNILIVGDADVVLDADWDWIFAVYDSELTAWIVLQGGAGGGGTLDDAYDFGGAGAGRIVTVDSGAIELRHTSNLAMLATRDPGDAVDRFALSRDGDMSWGSGAGAADVVLSRAAANHLALAAGDYLRTQYIADTAGNTRITTSAASPHVKLERDVHVYGISAGPRLRVGFTPPVGDTVIEATAHFGAYGVGAVVSLFKASHIGGGINVDTGSTVIGLFGLPIVFSVNGALLLNIYGLSFIPYVTAGGGGATVAQIVGTFSTYGVTSYSGTVIDAAGCVVRAPAIAGTLHSITLSTGVRIENYGNSAYTVDAYGLHILDMTLNTGFQRLMEVGPSTPYLRLVGGGNPAANQTNLYLKEAANLRQVRWMDPGAGGANFAGGERVMILV